MHREETRYVPQVEVDEHPGGLRLLCTRCDSLQVVLLTPPENDQAAKAFMLIHPYACGAVAPREPID
jgi:hypothetical protein